MPSANLTKEALVLLATPYFDQGSEEIFIAYCNQGLGKLYMATVPSGECKVCKIEHENHSILSLEDLPDPAELQGS
jgi:hypothetical protein